MSEKRVLLGCLILAALSLALPSVPSYDPWAWLTWGREIAFLDLDTRNGPSWKPLPVVFTTLFAPLGKIHDGIPPALWLVTARAGALIALLLRLQGGRAAGRAQPARGDRRRRRGRGGAGALAELAALHGARQRGPDGRRVHARRGGSPPGAGSHAGRPLVLGFLACLLRPEVFPFLALYGAMVWLREPGARRLVAGLAWRCRCCGSCRSGSAPATRSAPRGRRARSRRGACRCRSARGWRCSSAGTGWPGCRSRWARCSAWRSPGGGASGSRSRSARSRSAGWRSSWP